MMRCHLCNHEMDPRPHVPHLCALSAFDAKQIARGNSLSAIKELLGMSDTPQHHTIQAARNEERQKIIAFLEEEISRGKSLIGVQDMRGKPIYDDFQMQIGIDVLEYCVERIKEME